MRVLLTYLDNFPREKIVNDDPPGRTAGVDEALAGGVRGGEVAPDECLEDGVAGVTHHAAVPLHPGPLSHHSPSPGEESHGPHVLYWSGRYRGANLVIVIVIERRGPCPVRNSSLLDLTM